MATKFTSNRQKLLDIGISNYTEGSEVLTITGNTSISGIITAAVGAALTYYGDGSGLTGIGISQVGAISDVRSDPDPQLGGDLDLNGNDIIGTGDININGGIAATIFSGNGSGLTNINASSLSGIATDSDKLDGQDGSYYLDYSNFTGIPTIPTNNNQLTNGADYVTSSDNITGTSGGLSGAPNIVVTDITAVGNVSITGTLTCEDVNNIDSVGLITARTGVRVTDGGIEVSNGGASVTGVVTATSFIGDGSGLTGISTFTGDYTDLANTPTIPSDTSDLTNGAGYITSADGSNAATLDNIDSSQFLRSDVVDIKTDGELRFSDNVKATFGDSNDLEIHHNTTTSIMTNKTGILYIDTQATSGEIHLTSNNASEDMLKAVRDAQVELYYNNSKKFETTGTGIIVTGAIVKSGGTSSQFLKADGSVDDSVSFDSLSGKNSGTGLYSTSGDLEAGRGSGGVAMTIDDGYGDANLTFNHKSGTPEQDGNAARIAVNTDNTSNASITFSLKSNVTSGIATTATTILTLTESTATVNGTLSATNVNSSSDVSLKDNITTIPNALDKVLEMRGVEYDRNDLDGQHQIGVIAQEIEKVIPEVVSQDETSGLKSVSYGNITAVLIESVKELSSKVDELNKRLNETENSR